MKQSSEKSPHFLVVDDDISTRETIVEYLFSMGHPRVYQAKDGEEALRLMDAHPEINFVISDWEMPRLDGLSLLQKIRSDPSRKHIPFLIATSPGSHETDKVVAAAENLVSSYIIKPFRVKTFEEKVSELIREKLASPKSTVVLVDDDEDARDTVAEYLKVMGYGRVKAFGDPKAALKFLESSAPIVSLIVSDWEMPGLSGLELLKACKTLPALSEIPFLMITSQTSIERMKVMQAARANVDDYLLKPFTGDDLRTRVTNLFSRSDARAQAAEILSQAIASMGAGDVKAAEAQFKRALDVDPDSDVAFKGMGDIFVRTDRLKASIPYYKKAVEANPHQPQHYIALASAYLQSGYVKTAESLLLSSIAEVGFNADIHYHLGCVYHRLGKSQQAMTEFKIALDINADHPEAKVMLASLSGEGK